MSTECGVHYLRGGDTSHEVGCCRPVVAADSERLADFFVENDIPAVTRHFHPFPLRTDTAFRIARQDSADRYYVAVVDGDVIGFCMLRGWDEGFDIPTFGILIDHRWQGAGLGRRMTQFAIEQARELKCSAVRLTVYNSNTRALNLYRSMEFEEISREKVIASGQEDEKIVMRKLLA